MANFDDCLDIDFNGHSLRLTGTTDDLKWIAKDVCLALRLSDAALSKIPEEFKGVVSIQTDRQGQRLIWQESVVTVNQLGLEYLLNLANKQTALKFQKWFYEEAIAYIRKKAS